ncbi:hypothetical protein [Paenibacillus tyrfis]|nr:hypothetical protein [Paenibacillus tyrfis]
MKWLKRFRENKQYRNAIIRKFIFDIINKVIVSVVAKILFVFIMGLL